MPNASDNSLPLNHVATKALSVTLRFSPPSLLHTIDSRYVIIPEYETSEDHQEAAEAFTALDCMSGHCEEELSDSNDDREYYHAMTFSQSINEVAAEERQDDVGEGIERV